jgi:hypothetical protein
MKYRREEKKRGEDKREGNYRGNGKKERGR